MLNRVFAGFVVVFWAAMMAALLRVEIFPTPTALVSYPTERVLKKMFTNRTPARLNIYQGTASGESIGQCRIDIHPKLNGRFVEELLPGQQAEAYEVTSEVNMKLSVFGTPSWLRLKGKSTFNKRLDLEDFDMMTKIGGGRVHVTGDDVTKKVTVLFDFGDIHDERTFDFNQIQDVSLASALRIPGLANFSFLGGGGLPNSFGAAAGNNGTQAQPVTTTYFDRLEIAGSLQRVYLIYSKIDDRIWTKIWVSEADGEVLKVSTSFGLEMVSNLINVEASR